MFNFSFDLSLPPKGLSKDPNSLVIFPPEGNCNEGAVSMVDVHLKEVMSHASVKIICELEKQVLVCEEARSKGIYPTNVSLSTRYDEMEEVDGLGKKDKGGKKRHPGRFRKWMGDLCLQVCSPLDALEHFTQSVVDCRASNDSLWLAGSLEGFASSLLLLLLLEYDMSEVVGVEVGSVGVEERCIRLIEERVGEAIAIYSRNIIYCTMEVESILRLARTLENSPNVHHREMKVDIF